MLKKLPESVVFVGLAITFALLCRFLMFGLMQIVTKNTAAIITTVIFFVGWIFGVGAFALGSLREGWTFLRLYVGGIGALCLTLVPFVLLPHSAMLVVGAFLAWAWATFCLTGNARWLHDDW